MAVDPVDNFARCFALSGLYAEAAEKGYSEYLVTSREIEAIGNVDFDERLEELKRSRDLAGLQAIVFSAMCFEAAIYNFASVHLGDDYVRDHLDKLDILSKWLVVIRLVTGVEIPKSEAPYAALKNLIWVRNRLVHAKSEPINLEDGLEGIIQKMEKNEREFKRGVHGSFRALVLMSLYLDKVLNGYHNPLPIYAKNRIWHRNITRYKVLKAVIDDCRRVVEKI